MNPNPISNTERSGQRCLSLSRAVRRIPGVRHLDLDLYQYDPTTRRIEVVFEAYASETKIAYMTQNIARQLGAFLCLIQHSWGDEEGTQPVSFRIFRPSGELIHREDNTSWDRFREMMTYVHEYLARGGTP